MSLSGEVPHSIEKHLNAWAADWLAQHDLTTGARSVPGSSIPAGPESLMRSTRRCSCRGIFSPPVVRSLSDYGNMSSPTVFFVLQRSLGEGDDWSACAIGVRAWAGCGGGFAAPSRPVVGRPRLARQFRLVCGSGFARLCGSSRVLQQGSRP